MSGGLSKVQVRVFKALNIVYNRCVEAHKSQQYWIKTDILFQGIKGLNDTMQSVIQDTCLELQGSSYCMWDWNYVAKPDIKLTNRVVNRVMEESRKPKPGIYSFDLSEERGKKKEEVKEVGLDELTKKEKDLYYTLISLKEMVGNDERLKAHDVIKDLGVSQSIRYAITSVCFENERSRNRPLWRWVGGEVSTRLVKLVIKEAKDFNSRKNGKFREKKTQNKVVKEDKRQDEIKLTKRQKEVVRWYEETGDFKFNFVSKDGMMQFIHEFEERGDDGYFYIREDEAEVSLKDFYEEVFIKKGQEDIKLKVQRVFGLDELKNR